MGCCGVSVANCRMLIRFANSPGREFHVGNVEHPMISPIPRGIGLNVFCSWMLVMLWVSVLGVLG